MQTCNHFPFNRGQLATPTERSRVEDVIWELEMRTPIVDTATSEALLGRWALVYASEDPTRSSPFFWAFRCVCVRVCCPVPQVAVHWGCCPCRGEGVFGKANEARVVVVAPAAAAAAAPTPLGFGWPPADKDNGVSLSFGLLWHCECALSFMLRPCSALPL